MPTPIKRDNSPYWWFRKKVPKRYRAVVGKTEVWYSLQTAQKHVAVARCAIASAELEEEWAALLAGPDVPEPVPEAQAPIRPPRLPASSKSGPGFEPTALTYQDLHALRGAAHVLIRDGHIANPPGGGFGATRILARDLDESMSEFLEEQGVDATAADLKKFRPLYEQARRDAVEDLKRARLDGDFSANPILAKLPTRTAPKLDLVKAFEEYAEKGGLKGGADGPTAKRWRPKIRDFCRFVGHRDLTRMTSDDAYRWADHLIEKDYARKSVRLVWIASLSATASFMVERRRPGAHNPFRGIVVRDAVEEVKPGEKPPPPPRQKGFTQAEAVKILTATLDTPSSMISPEKRAARRWLPWLCAYSGARVNEITSLMPADVTKDPISGAWCMVIKPSLEKTAQWRTVPIHSHVLEQQDSPFLAYVEERRKLGKPLFYDPARGKGGKPANPQFKKTAERVAKWVRGLGIETVQPNHGWRHLFKSVARHVKMDREVEGFITGHRPKDANAGHDYGDRWTATMSAEIEKYPRFDVPELRQPPKPHRVRRRTRAQIAAEEAIKATRKASRAKRAA